MNVNVIFFSNNNTILGNKLKVSLRKVNLDVYYCCELESLMSFIKPNSKNIVFVDKRYSRYKKFISGLMASDYFENCKVVFIDDNMAEYVNFVNNKNRFCIPETKLEIGLSRIITTCELLSFNEGYLIDVCKLKDMLSSYLTQLGFSCKLVGYSYIKQCLEFAVKRNFNLGSLTSDVYGYVANLNSTTRSSIERNIRNAIYQAKEVNGFAVDGFEALQNDNISNRHFLAVLLDKLENNLYKLKN